MSRSSRRVSALVLACGLCAALAGCNLADLAAPTDSSSSGGSSSATLGTPITVGSGKWIGPNGLASATLRAPSTALRAVRMTLERTPGPWSLTANGDGNASTVPSITAIGGDGPCIRDQYVAAAMVQAWGVEAYARQGNAAQAYNTATDMNSSLRSAQRLCSNSPSVGGVTCATLRYITCDDLNAMTA